MFITAQTNNFKLLGHWLYNTKHGILNQDVLCLEILTYGSIEQTFQVIKDLIKVIIKESPERILEDSKNCFATELYSLYITFTTNLPDIPFEYNRNIILVTPTILCINDFNRPILNISLKGHHLNLNNRLLKDPLTDEILHLLVNNIDDFKFKPQISEYEKSEYFFEQLPFLKMMRDKKYELIGSYIFKLIITDKYHLKDEVLLSQIEQIECPWDRYNYKVLISNDIKMFINQKILTERLSVIAYRLAFWKFNEDRFIINKFYSQKLGLGEAKQLYTDNLDSKFLSRDLTFNRIFKGYDLRNLEEKQIQLAKEIIKTQYDRYDGKFDKETIHEVTCLSYEQINQLILQGEY